MLPAAPVCAELLKTEERYVCDLRDLVKYFVVPLRRAADRVDPVVSETVVRPLSRLGYRAVPGAPLCGSVLPRPLRRFLYALHGWDACRFGRVCVRVSPASPGTTASLQ